MDFMLQKGIFLAIIGVHLSKKIFMWPYVVKCITTGYLFYVLGGVSVGLLFFSCDKYLY